MNTPHRLAILVLDRDPAADVVGDWRWPFYDGLENCNSIFKFLIATKFVLVENDNHRLTQTQIHRSSSDDSDGSIDVVFLIDPSFGTWSDEDYRYLQSTWPLAKIVTVTGPWAAGGARSSKQWSGSHYVPAVSWQAQWQIFLEQFARHQPTLWDGPLTSSTTEKLARANTHQPQASTAIGLIGGDGSMLNALAETCNTLGHRIIEISDPTQLEQCFTQNHIDLCIWDWDAPQRQFSLLEMVTHSQFPTIILLGYAEILLASDLQSLTQLPNSIVLRKPFLIDELQAAISNLSFQNR